MTTKRNKVASQELARAIEFVQNPEKWPRWPVLPVMARVSTPREPLGKCGLLLADRETCQNGRPTVYFVNLFGLGDISGDTYEEKLHQCERHTFDSVQALLDEYRID